MSGENYGNREWTQEEIDSFSSKLTEEFNKEEHGGIFSGVPNNAFSCTPINMEPYHPKPTVCNCGDEMAKELDAILADVTSKPPIEWSAATKNTYDHFFVSNDFLDRIHELTTGIHITHITPPEQGWPIATYCPICKKTTFVLSPWAIKPEDGDYWLMNNTCADYEQHNMKMNPPKWKFVPLDPPPSFDMSSMMETTEEMTLEEAMKRYPDAKIKYGYGVWGTKG